jgi:hypothetical protein
MNLSTADPRIGTTTNKLVIYDSEGMGFQDLYCRTLYTYSDMTAKTNIRAINNATSMAMALKPVSYNWQDGSYEKQNKRTNSTQATELGFLAQDLEAVIPGAVVIDSEGNKLINYSAVIPVLTATIQELNARIEALEAQIK